MKTLLKSLFHIHRYDKPIVSHYVSFGSRDIIYECSCGKRIQRRVRRSFGSPFPIKTSTVSHAEMEKIRNGAKIKMLPDSDIVNFIEPEVHQIRTTPRADERGCASDND